MNAICVRTWYCIIMIKYSKPPVAEIIRHFNKVARPEYVGIVAAEIGHTIECVEEVILDLCDDGVLRPTTPAESNAHGGETISAMYVLTTPPSMKLARRP